MGRFLRNREEQVFSVLDSAIGALVGLVVVAVYSRDGAIWRQALSRGGAAWRRSCAVAGSLGMGYLLYRFFPMLGERSSATKAALYARGGRISLRTVIGKFLCTSATLASGTFRSDARDPAVQVGSELHRCWGGGWACGPTK